MVVVRRWVVGSVAAVIGLAGCSATAGNKVTSLPAAIIVASPASSVGISSAMPSPTSGAISTPAPAPAQTGSTSTPAPTVMPTLATSSHSSLFSTASSRQPGARLTLTGTVQAGVEASCLVLQDEKTGLQVNITGGEKSVVRAGARITAVGQIRNDLMSYCQQGPVFVVITATAG